VALTQRTPLKRGAPMARGSSQLGRGTGFKRQASAAPDASASREQRLQERAERAAAMALANAARGQAQGKPAVFTDLVASIPKENAVDHPGYRRLVASYACINCGRAGRSQHAHANEGKGLGFKTDDRTGFPLCSAAPGEEGCHIPFDQYRLVPGGREAHRELARRWGAQMRARIEAEGKWPKNLEKWSVNVAG